MERYAYEFGQRWDIRTPRRDIAFLVNRKHVSVPAEEIVAMIEARIPDDPAFTPAIRRECSAYARLRHERNRALYNRVMKGS